jgi:hypothetical protein
MWCRKTMRILSLVLLLAAGCGSDATAPRHLSLRVDPGLIAGLFTVGGPIPTGPPFSAGQAAVGQTVAVSLQVVDQDNTPVPGIAVGWSVHSGSGSSDAMTTLSDTGGIVRVNWTLDTLAKLDSMQASLASGTGGIVTARGVHAAALFVTKVAGDSQTVVAGLTSAPLLIRITDRFGNPAAGFNIAWGVIYGDGTLSRITTSTDANGFSEAAVTVGRTAGVCRVLATFAVMPAVTFSLKSQ